MIHMGLLDKIGARTIGKATNRVADRISSGIVDGIVGKKDESDETGTRNINIGGSINMDPGVAEQMSAMSSIGMQSAMGMAYNTKRCPNCKAVCVNSPVSCQYCSTDLTSVAPMTPKEMEELGMA